MVEPKGELNSKGILIAAALVMAAVYVLTGNHKHFTVTFTSSMLPKILKDKMPSDVKAILITATYVSKDTDWEPLTDRMVGGLVVNKMLDYFGRREN